LQQLDERQVVLYLDGRGLNQHLDDGLIACRLDRDHTATGLPRNGGRTAFVFHADTPALEPRSVARRRPCAGRARTPSADEEGLAARVFAASGQARYLLALAHAGFRLNFPRPSPPAIPTAGNSAPPWYWAPVNPMARLELWVRERLPMPGTFSHRLYHWALQPSLGRARWLGHWLVRRPLRDVLGMSRLRVPLLVGPPLTRKRGVLRRAGHSSARLARTAAPHDQRPSVVSIRPTSPPCTTTESVLLRLDDISLSFKGIKAITSISDVKAGDICGLIGPNGAGKSSLLNVINGVYHPRAAASATPARPGGACAPIKRPKRDRTDLSKHRAVQGHERARQRTHRPQPQAPQQLARTDAARAGRPVKTTRTACARKR
jgi:hypothetical protein